MNASDPTPCKGENVTDASFDYETLAQTLLRREFERIAYGVRDEFALAAAQLARGEDLTLEDVHELEHELRQAESVISLVRESVNDQQENDV